MAAVNYNLLFAVAYIPLYRLMKTRGGIVDIFSEMLALLVIHVGDKKEKEFDELFKDSENNGN